MINSGHFITLVESVDFDIQRVNSTKKIVFLGEWLFLARLTIFERVWIQSMTISLVEDIISIFSDEFYERIDNKSYVEKWSIKYFDIILWIKQYSH